MRNYIGKTILVGAAALSSFWIVQAQPQTSNPNFTGGTVTKLEDKSNPVIVRFKFDPGSRTKWHSHSQGQIVMVEEGWARHQVKGQQVEELKAGDTRWVGAGVVHWHGATATKGGTQYNVTRGEPQWLETVTEAEYTAAPKK